MENIYDNTFLNKYAMKNCNYFLSNYISTDLLSDTAPKKMHPTVQAKPK